MKIGSILEDAFKYPFSNWKRFITFGLFLLVVDILYNFYGIFGKTEYKFLILITYLMILVLIGGYLIRLIVYSIKGDNELPKFAQWSQMFVDGVKAFLAYIIYLLIPIILTIIGYFLLSRYHLVGGGTVIILIGLILTVFALFFVNMALANMAYYGKLSAVLEIREIFAKIKIIGWTRYIFLNIIIMGIGLFGTLITSSMKHFVLIHGLIGYFLIINYCELLMYRPFALMYKETLDLEQ
jgi:hypothetical protein